MSASLFAPACVIPLSTSAPAPSQPLPLLLIEARFSVPAPADPHQGHDVLCVHGVCLCVIETPCAQIR